MTSVETLSVHVVGAGGMLAGELLRLLEAHPVFGLGHAVTRGGGEPLAALHPQLWSDAATVGPAELGGALATEVADGEVAPWVVLALPHGSAAPFWRGLRDELGPTAELVRVVDLSADYRLKDSAAYARRYGDPHADPDELDDFVYALPELVPVHDGATRLAAPGCFATALSLATLPAARAHVLAPERTWVYHAITGSSGSGIKPVVGTHHPFRHGNTWSYAHSGHRHEAELAQVLAPIGLAPRVTFLPHSGPWVRGIHLTAVLPLASELTLDEARALYREHYAGRPFVRVLGEGAPDLRAVVGSNCAALGVFVRHDALVVELTLDNLIKGGSGQALQAMNLAAGLPETLGLPRTGLGAV